MKSGRRQLSTKKEPNQRAPMNRLPTGQSGGSGEFAHDRCSRRSPSSSAVAELC